MAKENSLRTKLAKFYNDDSKHSRYQNIPDFVKAETGYEEDLDELWRSDRPRYQYLLDVFKDLKFNSLLDVGANTGFFTLSFAKRFLEKEFTALELNPSHLEFIAIIKEHFQIDNLSTINQPLDSTTLDNMPKADVILLFNVLHHAGADFDKALVPSLKEYEDYVIDYLQKVSKNCKYLVYQMGYNWGGNKKRPIIELNDDAGKAIFTERILTKGNWKIKKVAYSRLNEEAQKYFYYERDAEFLANLGNEDYLKKHLNAEELKSQSEFYRRPIFICESTTI